MGKRPLSNANKSDEKKRKVKEEQPTENVSLKVEDVAEPVVKQEPIYHDEGSDDDEVVDVKIKSEAMDLSRNCPYLDTIDRKVLDFDFEKLCSVSLSTLNVYACLVCGKYYQGRGQKTHAYTHALDSDHHVFINLASSKIYCLPDGYEIIDASLNDIQFNLHPHFTKVELARITSNVTYTHALDGTDYLPGVVGLNNIRNTDWLNTIIQALSQVSPIRNFFIIQANYKDCKSVLVQTFGELLRKMWNSRNFKGHVSPHELLQAIATSSGKRYRIGQQSDPLQFTSWFLNQLHKDLGGNRKRNSSPITRAFQGEIQVTTDKPIILPGQKKGKPPSADKETKYVTTTEKKPFLYLSLDLPPAPLFKDGMDVNILPQVPLFDLLSKFDGETETVLPDGTRHRFRISRLPRFLIVHAQRFQENNWFVEKNPTLVNFPIKNLDMKLYKAESKPPTAEKLAKKSTVKELRKRLLARKVDITGVVEKADLCELLANNLQTSALKNSTKYDLLANVCHDGKWDKGTYRVHIYHGASDTWYEMQDLHVWSTETMPQLVALSEAYMQIYELQK